MKVQSLGGKIPWRKAWQPTPAFFSGETQGQSHLAGYGPQDCKELDKAEATQHAHTYRLDEQKDKNNVHITSGLWSESLIMALSRDQIWEKMSKAKWTEKECYP